MLAAADCAVILLDAARGVEEQTLKLFQVARARGIPLITFVNKYDRPGMEPLAMIDHVEQTLALTCAPLTWPVGHPGEFQGVITADDGVFTRFTRAARGATRAQAEEIAAEAPPRPIPPGTPPAKSSSCCRPTGGPGIRSCSRRER